MEKINAQIDVFMKKMTNEIQLFARYERIGASSRIFQ